jgi:hypothetical protein
MHEQYCFNIGWVVKSDSNGRHPKVLDQQKRKTSDMFWQEDMEAYDFFICSFGRSIAPTFGFTAHIKIHVVNAKYLEMHFIDAY